MRPSQGFGGTEEKGHLFQGNKGQILRGTVEQRKYLGTGNIRNKFSIFREQRSKQEQGHKYPLGRASYMAYEKPLVWYRPKT